MRNKFTVPELLESVALQMRAALGESLIPHPGELGTGREEVIRGFLRKHLPPLFGVSTGFVFDTNGNISKQIDVIIYDAYLCPKFEAVGGKLFFPCEAVVCVGEVKSVLSSKKDVEKALQNIRSVKNLDRSANNQNLSFPKEEPINQRLNHLDQIFTFLFVIDRCLSEVEFRKALFEHLCANERYLWPNVFYYFDHYLLTFCCKYGVCPNPMDAWGITSVTDRPRAELLLRFYRLIVMALGATTVSKFHWSTYLDVPDTYGGDVYRFKDAPVTGDIPTHMLTETDSLEEEW